MFGNVGFRKAEALSRVSYWDNKEKEKELSMEEVEERVKVKGNYKEWALL